MAVSFYLYENNSDMEETGVLTSKSGEKWRYMFSVSCSYDEGVLDMKFKAI